MLWKYERNNLVKPNNGKTWSLSLWPTWSCNMIMCCYEKSVQIFTVEVKRRWLHQSQRWCRMLVCVEKISLTNSGLCCWHLLFHLQKSQKDELASAETELKNLQGRCRLRRRSFSLFYPACLLIHSWKVELQVMILTLLLICETLKMCIMSCDDTYRWTR